MLVKENPLLVDVVALEKCYRVMDLLCEQCVQQQDMNEILAMKMHYISCVLQKCLAFLQECDDKLDALLKRWHHHYGPWISDGLANGVTKLYIFLLPKTSKRKRWWWLPSVPGEIHPWLYPEVSLLWGNPSAAAGSKHSTCGNCQYTTTHFNLTKESYNVESLIKYFIKNILYVILFIKILLYY